MESRNQQAVKLEELGNWERTPFVSVRATAHQDSWLPSRRDEEEGIANTATTYSLLVDPTRPAIVDDVTWARLVSQTEILVHWEPGKTAQDFVLKTIK